MKFGRFLAACAALALASGGACRGDEAGDLAKVVEGFYAAYSTFHPSDGIPDAAGRSKYEPFISSGLDKLLVDAARAEETFANANKDSPPLIEGDLFTSNFEGATSYVVGPCKGDSQAGQCTVALTYDDARDHPGDKPIMWSDTVYLLATPQGWRVDDIGYGAIWAFGNKGRLSDMLRSTIANAGN